MFKALSLLAVYWSRLHPVGGRSIDPPVLPNGLVDETPRPVVIRPLGGRKYHGRRKH